MRCCPWSKIDFSVVIYCLLSPKNLIHGWGEMDLIYGSNSKCSGGTRTSWIWRRGGGGGETFFQHLTPGSREGNIPENLELFMLTQKPDTLDTGCNMLLENVTLYLHHYHLCSFKITTICLLSQMGNERKTGLDWVVSIALWVKSSKMAAKIKNSPVFQWLWLLANW